MKRLHDRLPDICANFASHHQQHDQNVIIMHHFSSSTFIASFLSRSFTIFKSQFTHSLEHLQLSNRNIISVGRSLLSLYTCNVLCSNNGWINQFVINVYQLLVLLVNVKLTTYHIYIFIPVCNLSKTYL